MLRHALRAVGTSLGSVVAVTDASGTLISQQRYLPFGGERTNVGAISQTDYGYTGQRDLDPGMGGLMDYKARFYSPYLNHFIQPDTIIPSLYSPQSLNRFSYVENNPIRYNDPTGHCPQCAPLAPLAIPPILIVAGIVAFVGTVYLAVTPRAQVERDMEAAGAAIDRIERNFKKNASTISATISDSITHLTADKLDPTKPAENILPGSLKRKFPTGLLGRSLNEIEEALKKATGKEKSDLKTAKKILEQMKRLLQKPK